MAGAARKVMSMSRPVRRSWLPRYSLKVFLLTAVLGGCGIAWVCCHYHGYLVEQQLVQAITAMTLPRALM